MKFFIFSFLFFVSCSSYSFELESCSEDCSPSCRQEAKSAEAALQSHQQVCNNQEPTVLELECALSCAKGCKAVMRGVYQWLQKYYEYCGGGNGQWGRLLCVETHYGFRIVNSHSQQYVGEAYSMSHQCDKAIETFNGKVLCSRQGSGYAVFNLLGQHIGEPSVRLSSCKASVLTMKNGKICVAVSSQRYAIYDLQTLLKLKGDFAFLSTCQRNL